MISKSFLTPKQRLRTSSGFATCFALSLALTACTGEISERGRPSAGGGGAGGAGGVGVIDPASGNSTGWYEHLKGANCSAAPTALPASRIWRLSATQWKNTVASAFTGAAPDVSGFPSDTIDPISGFSDDSTDNKVTFPLATAYFDSSDQVATQAASAAVTAFPCLGTAPIAVACGKTFVAAYGKKLFRRALTDAETTSYANYLNSESMLDPAATAVTTILQAMVMSPNFIYRTELGNSKPGPVDLTQNEIAEMLSYTIADIPPDDPLLAAADKGLLSDPATRETQALRLVAMPSAKDKLMTFWREYLALGDAPTTPGIAASIYTEAQTFFNKVVWDQKGSYKDLLTASYTYADSTVAAVYGTAAPAADGRLTLDPKQRAGFMTSASMLVQTAAPSQAATVIHRGLLVRERILCETPPPPPPDVQRDPALIQQGGADATAKENYDLFAMNKPACNACHQMFQPLGLPFESYDALGKFRTSYPSGKPVITTGTLTDAGDATGPYNNVVDMATKLGASQIAQYCFTEQFAQFAFGRPMSFDQEECTIRSMGDYVVGKGGQVSQLFVSLANAPTAFQRFHQ
jgi:hypothetical protein